MSHLRRGILEAAVALLFLSKKTPWNTVPPEWPQYILYQMSSGNFTISFSFYISFLKKLIAQLFFRYSSRFSVVLTSIHGYMYPWDTKKINKLCISRETRIPSLKSVSITTLSQWHIFAQPFQKNQNHLLQCFTVSIKSVCPSNKI